ncbi:MAG TPA: cytochrome P450 [Xanthobacteraceae bacterium]|nr:cytochrome P450 [Xanthobacteraceae bacterium]
MGAVVSHPGRWRPPAPQPRVRPLGPIALIGALWKNPLEVWTQAHFEQPLVTANLAIGQATVVSAPAAVRRVLLDNAANYQKDTLQRRMMSAALSNGLLMAEGEQWRTQRRALAPLFARRAVISFAPAMAQAAAALVKRWQRHEDGAVRDVAADVTLLTLDVLERTIFSDGLGGDPREVRAAMRRYFDIIGRIEPFDLLGLPDFVPRVGRIKARPALMFFDRAVDTIIATRRRRLAHDPANVPDDILTLLLKAQDPETGQAMSEAEVRANIITFVAAGHETTANTISWTLFLLSRSAHWQERVVAEAEREIGGPVEGLAERLVETRAVIEEAIRLYPPLPAISRAAVAADELSGCRIKPGAMVVIAPYVLHRHRLLWERPDEFDPNRFLGSARAGIDRFAYLPFGVGPRICIGSGFALQEATLVVATVMKHFRLEPVSGRRVWPVLRVTLRPDGGLPMVVRRRNAAH